MAGPLEEIERTLPRYLSPTDAAELAAAITQFPNKIQYYGPASTGDIWQGDVFRNVQGIQVAADGPRFHRSQFMAISNTCDLAAGNERQFDVHACFAPITTVAKFENLMKKNGIDANRIASTVDAMRSQLKTSLFFLPNGGGGPEEDSIVFLDALQSQNVNDFRADNGKVRVFSLGQVGWYLLLVKLAIHFCRAFEGEARGAQPEKDSHQSASRPGFLERFKTWLLKQREALRDCTRDWL